MLFRISTAVALAMSCAIPATAAPPSWTGKVELAQATTQEGQNLAAYAAATVKVLQIQQAMNNEMNAAEQEDLSGIQANAQAAMVAAVEGEGLTVEEYNQIAQLTRTDPEAAATVERLIQQQLGG
jgi:hypothetical protein